MEEAPLLPARTLEALRSQIVAEIEARLNAQADSLWRRGEVELAKLHREREQVVTSFNTIQARQDDLQARQDALQEENAKLRSTCTQMTEKLEMMVSEMREALRLLPPREPSAEMPATVKLASPPGLPELTPEAPPSPQVLSGPWAEPGGPRTPPRPLVFSTPMDGPGTPWSAASAGSPAPWGGAPGSAGPAVRLSLASALPSAPAEEPTPPHLQSTPGSKTLQLAECLEHESFPGERPSPLGASCTGGGPEAAVGGVLGLRAEAPAFVPSSATPGATGMPSFEKTLPCDPLAILTGASSSETGVTAANGQH